MKKKLLFVLALVLCLSLLLPCVAFAADENESILDAAEMQAMLDDYIASHKLNPEKISVGYIYTETGDTFYYNEDTWYYSASTYKVPVMMLLAEQEARGEIERETKLKGLPLSYAEEAILTYSNNDYAHLMMSVLAPTEPECRDLYKQYASLPDDYYISDFRDYSYFTARFLTEVMQTLYNEPERFPNIIECLLAAQPDHYFRIYLPGYDIAQKYGSYQDYVGRDFNHTTAIIYLPHPIILTVMTQDCPASESVLAELAELFANYTLKVDEKLAEREAQAAEEAERKAEEERLAAETAPRPEEEAGLESAPEPTPEPTTEPTPAATEPVTPAVTETAQLETRLYILGGAALILVVGLVSVIFRRR